jgi:hypothetical protein
MFALTKTLVTIALGATAIGSATLAATGLGGLDMSLNPPAVTDAWKGYSVEWNGAGWQCLSKEPNQAILIGVHATDDGWDGMALAACYNGWASPFLNTSRLRQTDSFDRRFVGIQTSRPLVVQ